MHIILVAVASVWALGAFLALVFARAAGRRAPQPGDGAEEVIQTAHGADRGLKLT